MRLLITGINYAPEETGIAPYTTMMAEHYAELGHEVSVVTGMPHYPSWHVEPEYRGRIWRSERIGGVDVQRNWHYVPRKQSAVRRGLYEGSFLLTGLRRLVSHRPDAVLGVVPSLGGGLLARLAATRFNVPYGVFFQDLMGPAAAESGVSGGKSASKPVRAAEKWAVARASAVGSITEGFNPYLMSLGVAEERLYCVRNWTHIPEPTEDAKTTRARLGLPEQSFLCLHAGNMGYKQGLENVIQSARLAQVGGQDNLHFVFIGDGNRREALQALAENYQLRNIHFLPIQPKDQLGNLLHAADALLINQKGTIRDMSLPGKLTSYFFSGRPVVAAVAESSETAREIRASGGGVLVPADDPLALMDCLRDLSTDALRRQRLGNAARNYASVHLTAEAALRASETFLDAIVGMRAPAREPSLEAPSVLHGTPEFEQAPRRAA